MSNIPPKVRARVYSRDGNQCVRCGVYVTSDNGRQIHHRLFLSRGGKHDLANLITACRECHSEIHAHNITSSTAGWVIPTGGDPTEVPVLYWHSRKVFLSNSPEFEVA